MNNVERYFATPNAAKIGEAIRPSTFKIPERVPDATQHEELFRQKMPGTPMLLSEEMIMDEASATAKAWLKHPANKMQLSSFKKEHDTDGDGLISQNEFSSLLKAAGSNSSGTDAAALFNFMDKDGDGTLDEAELKALGQDQHGLGKRWAGAGTSVL
jgi:hypothetical protein